MQISQIQIITMAKRIILSNHFTVVVVVAAVVVRASIKIDDNRAPINGNQKKEIEKSETKTNSLLECRTLPIWKQERQPMDVADSFVAT